MTRVTSVVAIVAHVVLAFGLGPCQCIPDRSQGQEACCCGPHVAGACPMGTAGGTCHDPSEGEEEETTSALAPSCLMPLSGAGVVEPASAQPLVSAPPPPTAVAFLASIPELSPPRETASPPPTVYPPRWSAPALLKSTVLRV